MKKVTITVGAILMAAAWFAFAHQAAAETDDQSEIRALESQLAKAINATYDSIGQSAQGGGHDESVESKGDGHDWIGSCAYRKRADDRAPT